MKRAKRSPIWTLSTEEFKFLIENSKSYADVFAFFGMKNKGDNYKTITQRLQQDQVSIEHFKRSRPKRVSQPLSEILVEGSSFNRTHLKERLLREDILEYKCQVCRIGPMWNGLALTLQLDHKNGISNDNRLENLQFICPNCHSQTTSFAGRNKKYVDS